MKLQEKDVPQPPPPGHCFSNEHYVSGCFTGRRSIRQSWACNALAEMLSGRPAPAISRASVGPSGAGRFKIERRVFNTRVGTNLSCQGAFNKPLPCSSGVLFDVCRPQVLIISCLIPRFEKMINYAVAVAQFIPAALVSVSFVKSMRVCVMQECLLARRVHRL